MSVENYRRNHLPHHQHLGSFEKDLEVKDRLLIRRGLFWRTVFLSVSGVIALRAVKNQAVASSEVGNSEKFGNIARILVVQATILLAFTTLAGPVSYLLLWVLPLVTLTPLLITLRVIAEHQSVEYALSEIENHMSDIEPPMTRTIPGTWIERFLLVS